MWIQISIVLLLNIGSQLGVVALDTEGPITGYNVSILNAHRLNEFILVISILMCVN